MVLGKMNKNVNIVLFGCSSTEVAKALDISTESARNKIRGRTEFTLSEVVKLCKLLCVTFNELDQELKRIKEN